MRILTILAILLLVIACTPKLEPIVPVEEILNGESTVAKKTEVVPEPVVIPEPTDPVVEPEPVKVAEPVEVIEKPAEKGDVKGIEILIKKSSSIVDVKFENGNEEFTTSNTDPALIKGMLMGKYDLNELKIDQITEFYYETQSVKEVEVEKEEVKQVTSTQIIKLKAYSFQPEVIRISPGTAIVWTHEDLASHTITTTSGPESFDSGILNRGDTYTFNFFDKGTYDYYSTT